MRFKLMLLLLAICTLTTSCDWFEKNPLETSASSTVFSTEQKPDGNYDILHLPETISYLEEYYQFIDENELPREFITYDDLKDMGEFKAFAYEDQLDWYTYLFRNDSKQYAITIIQTAGDYAWGFKQTLFEEPNEDLRKYPNGLSGEYSIDASEDIWYLYTNGCLGKIELKSNETIIEIYGEYGMYLFPNDETNLISRLLNKNTALEAKAEFDALILDDGE